jgi:hypothetical protein
MVAIRDRMVSTFVLKRSHERMFRLVQDKKVLQNLACDIQTKEASTTEGMQGVCWSINFLSTVNDNLTTSDGLFHLRQTHLADGY